jgi:GT2 family glycosyltransferase
VLLINPDARLMDGSLGQLAALALAEQALCGPELLNADGSRQPSASALPAGWEVGAQAVFPATVLPHTVRVRCEPWRSPRTIDVGWLTAACIAGPRDLLLDLGPFDESIHLYGEDLDLGLRARRQGVRSIFAPDVARVVHLGGRSAERRFTDGGAARKLATRRVVVRRHVGPWRERYDFGAQLLFHATRYAAKTALGRDAQREGDWLAVARARLRAAP